MRRQRMVVVAVVVAAWVGAVVKFGTQGGVEVEPQEPGIEVVADGESFSRQEPVGWVFGRMVGFPGADRPLTGQPGSFGGAPLPPPNALPR